MKETREASREEQWNREEGTIAWCESNHNIRARVRVRARGAGPATPAPAGGGGAFLDLELVEVPRH